MIFDVLLAPWQETYFQKTFFMGMLAVCMAGPIGCLLVLRGKAFLAHLIVHSVIVGSLVGCLVIKTFLGEGEWGSIVVIFSCLTPVVALGVLRFLKTTTEIGNESLATSLFLGILGLVVFSTVYFQDILRMGFQPLLLGDILQCTSNDLWFAGLSAVIICSIVVLFFRHFQLASIDPVMAASLGISVCVLDCLLVTTTTLAAVCSVSVMGGLVVVTLFVVPQVTARLVAKRLWTIMVLSVIFGLVSLLLGLYLCVWLNTTSLGTIIVISLLQLFIVLLFAPQGIIFSWLDAKRVIPEILLENILVVLYRNGGFAKQSFVFKSVDEREKTIVAGIRIVIRDGLVCATPSGYSLTEKGIQRGEYLEKAQGLWETYLVSTGSDQEEISQQTRNRHYAHSPELIAYFSKRVNSLKEKQQ